MIAITIFVASSITIALYAAFRALHARTKSVLFLPVLATSLVIGAALVLFRFDLAHYAQGTRWLGFLLGPATVALAVPLHRSWDLLRREWRAVLASVTIGAAIGVGSVVLLGRLVRLDPTLVRTLAPKSVTTPIAMPISERLGGLPSLTAAIVVVTGIFGMMVGPPLLTRLGIRSEVARGLAIGASAHGVGTARALEEGEVQGASSGVAVIVSGVITALIAAAMARLL